MTRRLLGLFVLLAGFAFAQNRVYELRTYTCNEGKLETLKTRFRDHTIEIFKRHGMESIGYWVPQDGERSKTTLIYIISHASREAAKANWAAFSADPEWKICGGLAKHARQILLESALRATVNQQVADSDTLAS